VGCGFGERLGLRPLLVGVGVTLTDGVAVTLEADGVGVAAGTAAPLAGRLRGVRPTGAGSAGRGLVRADGAVRDGFG
jgi:hypothetical protein